VEEFFYIMKRAFIFANGEAEDISSTWIDPQPSDLLIAADGGARLCKIMGVKPHVIIGDFDSLLPEELITYDTDGIDLIRFPAQKDETDLELALHYALKHEVQEIVIIGALGRRWDMTLANSLLPTLDIYKNIRIRLIDAHQKMFYLRENDTIDIYGEAGDTVSLIPISGEASGISTQGLKYPLRDETLYLGSPRGVSNELVGRQASVHLEKGILICMILKPSTE
jgi:thiamine pyrophosphokinase